MSLDLVKEEMERQQALWGEQNHVDGTSSFWYGTKLDKCREENAQAVTDGTLTWKLILEEEFLEAINETDEAKLQEELVQVAAVCLQWHRAITRRKQSGAV